MRSGRRLLWLALAAIGIAVTGCVTVDKEDYEVRGYLRNDLAPWLATLGDAVCKVATIDARSAAIVGLFEVVTANLRKAHDSRKLRANRGYQVCTGKHIQTSWILSRAHFPRRAKRNLRAPTHWAREDRHFSTVGLLDQVSRNHFSRPAGAHNPSSMKEYQCFAKGCRGREVVKHHDDGHLMLAVQGPQEIEGRDLMVDIKVRVRLVEHQD